jgi:diaminopimelate epimerase
LAPLFEKESALQPHVEFVQRHLKGCFRSNPGTDHLILHLNGKDGDFILSDPTLFEASNLRNQLFEIARAIRFAPIFSPDGINVNFARQMSSNHFELLTYERGVEQFTLSCGTGTIATALSFILSNKLPERSSTQHMDPLEKVTIRTDGGTLKIEGKNISSNTDSAHLPKRAQFDSISLTGPARFVAEGSFMLPI